MMKFNRIICAVLIGVAAGSAYAKARKILSFKPEGGENPAADGVAILNFHPGGSTTDVQIALSDFTPDTHYELYLEPGGYVLGGILTNDSGNGSVHDDTFFGDITSSECTRVFVYFDNGDVAGEFDPADEVRAVGSNCP